MESLVTDIIFAMGQPQGEGQGGGPSLITCLMPLAFLGIFYALLIRPQQKQQKEHKKLVEQIKSGDRVIAAGMVGTITNVKKDSIILKSADSKVELARGAIERFITDDDDAPDKK
jgi:preprotein translocase subunit YajC|tara:strand:+ start:33 stop:377 length:345 start_codon:yes stop_codon:yes gene_type:complete